MAERKPDPATTIANPFTGSAPPKPQMEFATMAMAIHNAESSSFEVQEILKDKEMGEPTLTQRWKVVAHLQFFLVSCVPT